MTKNADWRPDDEEAMKALIRDTIRNIGATDPSQLPHKIKERLGARAKGEIDIDELIRQVTEEAKKRGD